MSTVADVAVITGGCAIIGAYCYLETPVIIWWAGVRERWATANATVDAVAAGWIPPLAPGDQLVLIDHAHCEAPDCDAIICCCPTGGQVGRPCVGTVEQACVHHSLLCHDCALAECVDCRVDAREDAGCRS